MYQPRSVILVHLNGLIRLLATVNFGSPFSTRSIAMDLMSSWWALRVVELFNQRRSEEGRISINFEGSNSWNLFDLESIKRLERRFDYITVRQILDDRKLE